MIKDIEFLLKKLFFSEKYLLHKRLKRALKGNYEDELKIINRFSDKSKDAVDIGVYRGVYSYELAKHFKKVHSFEPNPLIYPYLIKNLPKIISNITLYNYALSDKNSDAVLKLPLRSKSIFKSNIEEIFKLGTASIHKDNKLNNYKSFTVKTMKLDDLNLQNNIGFIKIDVEGHEKNVLYGAETTIKNNMPTMLIEIEQKHTNKPVIETINMVESYNYNTFVFDKNELININNYKDLEKKRNFIFIKK